MTKLVVFKHKLGILTYYIKLSQLATVDFVIQRLQKLYVFQ